MRITHGITISLHLHDIVHFTVLATLILNTNNKIRKQWNLKVAKILATVMKTKQMQSPDQHRKQVALIPMYPNQKKGKMFCFE